MSSSVRIKMVHDEIDPDALEAASAKAEDGNPAGKISSSLEFRAHACVKKMEQDSVQPPADSGMQYMPTRARAGKKGGRSRRPASEKNMDSGSESPAFVVAAATPSVKRIPATQYTPGTGGSLSAASTISPELGSAFPDIIQREIHSAHQGKGMLKQLTGLNALDTPLKIEVLDKKFELARTDSLPSPAHSTPSTSTVESGPIRPDSRRHKSNAGGRALRYHHDNSQALEKFCGSMQGVAELTDVTDMQAHCEDVFESVSVLLRSGHFEHGCPASIISGASQNMNKCISELVAERESEYMSQEERDTVARCAVFSMYIFRSDFSSLRPGLTFPVDFLSNIIEMLSKIVTKSTDNDDKKRGKASGRGSGALGDAVENTLLALRDVLASHAVVRDQDLIRAERLGFEGLVYSSIGQIPAISIQILRIIFSRNQAQRGSILEECFHLIENERVPKQGRLARTISLDGCLRPVLPVTAVLLQALQSIAFDEGENEEKLLEGQIKNCISYFIGLFETRFTTKSQQKGQMKDVDAKALLFNIVDDIFCVLHKPQWPVAELFLHHMIDHLEVMIKNATEKKLSEFYRGVLIELLCSILTRLLKQKVLADESLFSASPAVLQSNASTSGLDALSRECAGEHSGHIERELEDQLENICDKYAGGDSVIRQAFQSPIKKVKAKQHSSDLLDVQLRQLVLNFLSSDCEFTHGSLCHDAHRLHTALWCCDAMNPGISCENDNFWMAQSKYAAESDEGLVIPVLPSAQIEAACLKLGLSRALLSNLSHRFTVLVALLRNGKPADRVKLLRATTEAISLDPSLIHPNFIILVRDVFVMDPENALIRTAAVDFLAKFVIIELRNSVDEKIESDYKAVCGRCMDTSLSVRLSVLAFFREICRLDRDTRAESNGASNTENLVEIKLVGSAISMTIPGQKLVNGMVVSYDKTQGYRVMYGDGDMEDMPLDKVKAILVAPSHERPVVSKRMTDVCMKTAGMLRNQGEDSLKKACMNLFRDLWFPFGTQSSTPSIRNTSVESCVLEMTRTVEAWVETFPDSTPSAGIEWLQQIVSEASSSPASVLCKMYIDNLVSKVSTIHNMSSSLSGSLKLSQYQDFQSRALSLLPVLWTLLPFVKAEPQLLANYMCDLQVIIVETELSKEHLDVLRVMLQIFDVMFAKVVGIPERVVEEICRAFSSGAFKLSDPKRWTNPDDMCKAVKCFCTVVQYNRSTFALNLLFQMLENYVSFLKGYLIEPTEAKAAWVARSLVLSGALVRYFDLSSLDEPQRSAAMQAQEHLFSIGMSHYVNHKNEVIRRCTLQALGSIFVRAPQKMLQTACTKLLTKSLLSTSPPSLRSQVLRNLLDHFATEGSEIAHNASKGVESEQGLVVVSDTSTALIHLFHNQILSASLSENLTVRLDAVVLIRGILGRGLTAPYLCLPFLFAQQCQPTCAAARVAMQVLDDVHMKDTSHYTPNSLLDGIRKSFQLYQNADALPLGRDAFVAAFKHLAGTGKDSESKAVRQLINKAFEQFPSQWSPNTPAENSDSTLPSALSMKTFLVSVFASLPYQTLDGPQYLIHFVGQHATVLGGSCLSNLHTAIEATRDQHASTGTSPAQDSSPPSSPKGRNIPTSSVDKRQMEVWMEEAQTMALLLSLQARLQAVYGLKSDRIRKFSLDPTALDKMLVKDLEVDSGCFDPLVLFRYSWDPNTMLEDLQSDYDKLYKLLQSSLGCEELTNAPVSCATAESDEAETVIANKKAKRGGHSKKSGGTKVKAEDGGKGASGGGAEQEDGGRDTDVEIESVKPHKKAKIQTQPQKKRKAQDEDEFAPSTKVAHKTSKGAEEQKAPSQRPSRTRKPHPIYIGDDSDGDVETPRKKGKKK